MTPQSRPISDVRLHVIVLLWCSAAIGVPSVIAQDDSFFRVYSGDYDLIRHEGHSLPAAVSADAGSSCGQDGDKVMWRFSRPVLSEG